MVDFKKIENDLKVIIEQSGVENENAYSYGIYKSVVKLISMGIENYHRQIQENKE